jgi:hypothetical protein
MRFIFFGTRLLLTIAVLTVKPAFGDLFMYTTIDYPNSGNMTEATGINNLNQIVGDYKDAFGFHGFVYESGFFMSVDYSPSALATFLDGINDNGEISGTYFVNPPAVGFGFLYSNGTAMPLVVPGFTFLELGGINDTGQVVGTTGFSGIVYANGAISAVQHLGSSGFGAQTSFEGINSSGQIVGYYYPNAPINNAPQGFLYSAGTFTDFPVSYLTGINDSGEIVGSNVGGDSFVYQDGTFTSIHVPGGRNTRAQGINNAGDIVGEYDDSTGTHGFLAVPVPAPEPTSFTFLFVGSLAAGACGFCKRARKVRRAQDVVF